VRALALLLIVTTAPAFAADNDDSRALSLADSTLAKAERASDWRVFTEAAWSQSTLRGSDSLQQGARWSLDARFDKNLAADWRVVLADRFDVNWRDSLWQAREVNTPKDAYVSWQARPDRIGDLGRINALYGVAYAYNPTDYFRANAVRSVVSIDPASLRENRLGSVMLRGQMLWPGGSFTALYSPKLADQPSDSPLSLDLGATNDRNRWLLAASQKISENLNPQEMLYGVAGEAPQMGVNLTSLLNDATVTYLEWSGGRSASLLAQALQIPEDVAFRSRLAAGLTYTAPIKLSMTVEYQYNGAGLDQAGWEALRQGPPAAYVRYRTFVAGQQDPPTQQKVFLRASWQDSLANHLDLTTNFFLSVVDSSRQWWVEVRYHWTHVDIALQWQVNSGSPGSEYGAIGERQVWQALATYFF